LTSLPLDPQSAPRDVLDVPTTTPRPPSAPAERQLFNSKLVAVRPPPTTRNSEHDKELNHHLKGLNEWKERALKNEVEIQRLTDDLTQWKDRTLKNEAENRRLVNELMEWKDRALKAEGQTRGFHSSTSRQMLPQVTVYLDNPSDFYISYSYKEAGETTEGVVVPCGKSEILCLVNREYTISLTSGSSQGYIRQVFNQDNHRIVLPNWLR